MHQTRSETTKKIPITRKGTRYVVRARIAPQNAIPVLIAVRDMLQLARTAKEVNEMVKLKLLKINGKEVKDYHESIQLFNIFEADKAYILSLTQNGRFILEHSKQPERLCKIIKRSMFKGNKIQLNLHDGTNILVDDKKYLVNDSLYLDSSGKIKKHISFAKGATVKAISGKYAGQDGKVEELQGNTIKLKINESNAVLDKSAVILL